MINTFSFQFSMENQSKNQSHNWHHNRKFHSSLSRLSQPSHPPPHPTCTEYNLFRKCCVLKMMCLNFWTEYKMQRRNKLLRRTLPVKLPILIFFNAKDKYERISFKELYLNGSNATNINLIKRSQHASVHHIQSHTNSHFIVYFNLECFLLHGFIRKKIKEKKNVCI